VLIWKFNNFDLPNILYEGGVNMNYGDLFNFSGKVVLITGGGGSLGQEFGRAFSQCGANVILADINEDRLKECTTELTKEGGKVNYIVTDVTNIDSINNMVNKAVEQFGKIDIFCNHAGINIRKPAVDFTIEDWNKIVDINLKGIFFTAVAVGKIMINQGSGKIINTASVSAARGHLNMALYTMTKGGISQLTKALAHEWAKYKINVNAIGPGYIETNQTRAYLNNPETYKSIVAKIPLGRLGTPQDIAAVELFLASKAADYITGQTIYVEGGRMID